MMPNSSTHHIPVLLNEVLQVLAAKEGEVVVDATLGGGGHTAELLKAVGPSGRVIGLDADAAAIAQAKAKFANQSNFEARLGNFANIAELIGEPK
ncbi:MAG TPA: 16S rRNA (cytosine(1402)-N(4))-methyltransferase, partial [Flavobacterium sp.]|nr:16S rRNA (cytosine(1402)-N(4))-methyltransferase [Flavobacterium sp.]